MGGVGVSSAVRAFLAGKIETIATLKTIGATGRGVFYVYFIQVFVLTLWLTAVLGFSPAAVQQQATLTSLSASQDDSSAPVQSRRSVLLDTFSSALSIAALVSAAPSRANLASGPEADSVWRDAQIARGAPLTQFRVGSMFAAVRRLNVLKIDRHYQPIQLHIRTCVVMKNNRGKKNATQLFQALTVPTVP